MCWDLQQVNRDTTKVKFQGAALDCISVHNLKNAM